MPLGEQGGKAATKPIAQADATMLGRVRPISAGLCGDEKAPAAALHARLRTVRDAKAACAKVRGEWTHERDAWSIETARASSQMHPREMLLVGVKFDRPPRRAAAGRSMGAEGIVADEAGGVLSKPERHLEKCNACVRVPRTWRDRRG